MRNKGQGNSFTKNIVQDLGVAIVTGQYTNIPFPTENDLSEKYSASRTVTREAVKMLTAKGLLSARPRKGTKIEPEDNWNLFDPDVMNWILERNFSLDLLIEFMQIRKGVEPQAAALAAINATPKERAAISQSIERMYAAEKGEDDTLEADIAFHIAVLEASHNRFFKQLKDMIQTTLRYSIRKTNDLRGMKLSDSYSHKITAEAIIAGDAAGAQQRMYEMMDHALNLMLKAREKEKSLA